MYKYTFGVGSCINVKTPKVDSLDDIKKTFEQSADCIKSHLEYPNGLVLDIEERPAQIIYVSNKRIILLEDGTLGFEE